MPSSTDSDVITEIGDQSWDDEALARAMALSLQEASSSPTEPVEIGAGGMEELLYLLPRADGFSPLSASPSPRQTPGGLGEAARGSDDAMSQPGSKSDATGCARALVSDHAVVSSNPRPYLAAYPISGGTDTYNTVVIDTVLREVEKQGSEFSGEVVRKMMSAMLESGKVRPVRPLETIVCSGPSETYSYIQLTRALADIEDRLLHQGMDLRDVSSDLIDQELKELNRDGYFGPAPRADGQVRVRFMNLSDELMDVYLAGSSQPCTDRPLVPYTPGSQGQCTFAMLCPDRPSFVVSAGSTRTTYRTNDDDCQLVFVRRSQASPDSTSADPSLVHFYNFTGVAADVEVPEERQRLTVDPVGLIRQYPYRYMSACITVHPGSECIVRVHNGNYPSTSYVANGDNGQIVFLERVVLPEEQEFEAIATALMEAPFKMLTEWKVERGKQRRLATLLNFQRLEAMFEEQVSILESAIGRLRARESVEKMREKIIAAITELESAHDLTGLKNQGATCYMNSLLQALYMTPELRLALYRWQWDAARGESKEDSIPYQLQKLFCLLQTAETAAVDTRQLTTSFGWTGAEAFQQHDVNELFNIFCDSLENNFRGTTGAGVIKNLFAGRENQYVRCEVCGFKSSQEEEFRAVIIPVKQHGDPHSIGSIEEGLDNYYRSERLCGDNQWYCEKCKKKVDAEKGAALSKVPYLLTVNMQRFVFDWSTEQATKLGDRVTFPETLDVARYLDEALPLHKTGSKNDTESTQFGKNGSSILMRGRSAIGLETPDALNYDLYAILIHTGTAGAGHYYAYIRDFEKNLWFEFNDETVTGPLGRGHWERAFGGYERNAYGYDVPQGSAYVLMYRRREPACNIDAVADTCIPQQVLADIVRENDAAREAALAKEAEEERRRDAISFAVCNGDQMHILWVKEMLSWDGVLQQVHHELNLELALDDIRLVQLEPIQHLDRTLRDTSGTTPVVFKCAGDTLVKDILHLHGAICQLDVKPPGEDWNDALQTSRAGSAHIYYRECGGHDITGLLTCDVGVPLRTVLEQMSDVLHIPETESLQLYSHKNERVSGLAVRTMCGQYRTLTPQWMHASLKQTVGAGATEQLCEMLKSEELDGSIYSGHVFFVNYSEHPIRIARKVLEYDSGLRMNLQVSRTLETLGGRSTPESVAAMCHTPAYRDDTYEISCYSVGFEELHVCSNDYMHQIVIITDEVQIMDARTLLQFKIGPRPRATSVATVTAGPKTLPVYRFHGHEDDLSEFLFEVNIETHALARFGVLDFKEIVSAKMEETEGVEAAAAPYLRLCKLGGNVFRDDQTMDEAFDGVVHGSEKIGLTVRDSPEDKEVDSKVISVIRYYPESFALADEHLEITLRTTGYDVTADRMRDAIAKALGDGGLPAKQISVACASLYRGKKTDTAADMQFMQWDYTGGIQLYRDNCLFYYKDIDAAELVLTEEERTERTKKLVILRQKKTRESRPAPDVVREARIQIRGAGMTPQDSNDQVSSGEHVEPHHDGEGGVEDIVDHTVSSELHYHSGLLSNPNLSDAQRHKILRLQSELGPEHTTQAKDASDELGIWLSRTPSRQDLARNRRELEILQALGDDDAEPLALVRTPSAATRYGAAEVARLEQMGTHAEMARVKAEVARLKRELGLQVQ